MDFWDTKQRWMQPQVWKVLSAASHKADEALTDPGCRAECPGDLPNLSQSFLSLIHHKNFLLFVFMSLTLCSSNSISGSSVSFSQCPLWSVPLSLGFTSVGFPVSDSYFFCSNNLLNFVFKHMDPFAFCSFSQRMLFLFAVTGCGVLKQLLCLN